MNCAQRLIEAAVAAVFLLAGLMLVPAGADTVVDTCVTTATKFRSTDTAQGTTSATFVNIPQSGIPFVQGGSAPDCVIVSFTAVMTNANAWMVVKATLDGNNPVDPEAGVWRASVQDTRTAVFAFPNVAPGNHSVVMKFRSTSNGQNVTVYNRITTVSYRR